MVRTYRRLGELLLDRGAVSYLDLSIALADQKVSKRRLGEILIDRGFTAEGEIAACLAQQSGYPIVDLSQVSPQAEALRLLSAEDALQMNALPLEMTQNGLAVAVSNPTDGPALDHLAGLVRSSLIVHVAPSLTLRQTIRKVYGLNASGQGDDFAEQAHAPRRYKELVGRFRFDGTIVFDATDSVLGRPVSMACIPIGDPNADAMVEAVRSASLGSIPGIAPIYDSVTEGLYRWTVTARIQGDSLESMLRGLGPRTLVQAAETVANVAESLDHLHRLGGRTDWVCARNLFQGPHGLSALPVSLPPSNYRSPSIEQDSPGAAAAYALGALLCDCVYGVSGTHNRTIPAAMRTILETALARQSKDRYGSAIEVASALRSFNWQALSDPLAISGDLHRERLLDTLSANQKDLYQKPNLIDRMTKKKRAA